MDKTRHFLAGIAAAGLFWVSGNLPAQEEPTGLRERMAYKPDKANFRAEEFNVDIFGSYSRGSVKANDFFDEPDGGDWGGGIGLSYFIVPYFGFGGEVYASENGNKFIDYTSFNLIGRFPIGDTFAPYVLGGVGHVFDPEEEWARQAGAGVEFRLNPHTGIFADGRYVWVESGPDFSIIRAGIRLAF